MKKLHDKILNWAVKYNIIYSSCYTPSEGEHKLLQFIRNNNEINKKLRKLKKKFLINLSLLY